MTDSHTDLMQLVFAHCDLLSGNVIVLPKSEGPDGSVIDSKADVNVTFIDYEYATPSPAAFDMANHFAEWGGFDCDFSVLPTRSQRLDFIRHYVAAYFSWLQPSMPAAAVEAEAQKLFAEVDMFRGVPGFYWGVWALIQATISEIDFDYASYAETRLGEYWAWRAETDGSRKASGLEMPLRERRWAQEE
jgi:ethanolamine kinase